MGPGQIENLEADLIEAQERVDYYKRHAEALAGVASSLQGEVQRLNAVVQRLKQQLERKTEP